MEGGLKSDYFQKKKAPNNSAIEFKKKIIRVKSVNTLREKNWDNRFIYSKIPDIYKNTSKINSKNNANEKILYQKLKTKYNSSRKKLEKIIKNNYMDNTLYLYNRPLSNPMMFGMNFLNKKNDLKTGSKLIQSQCFNNSINNGSGFMINYHSDNNINNNLESSGHKKNENYTNDENLVNSSSYRINMINLKSINKLWDELAVNKNYRKLFLVIYKELDEEAKEELYQKEINELMTIKNDINTLKDSIEFRLTTIKELMQLNTKLNKEVINKNNKLNESIIAEISDKIEILRERTIKVCNSMKKLKIELNGIKNLDKFDINKVAERFKFDKNYLIKMKGELMFLREGFAKYYFNISNDQTPFLLKASEKNELINNKDPFIHLVPLNTNLKNDIQECTYYIYQELIAYQNEKVNKKILRCISPMKIMTNGCNYIDSKISENKNNKDNEIKVEIGKNNNDSEILKSNNKNNNLSKTESKKNYDEKKIENIISPLCLKNDFENLQNKNDNNISIDKEKIEQNIEELIDSNIKNNAVNNKDNSIENNDLNNNIENKVENNAVLNKENDIENKIEKKEENNIGIKKEDNLENKLENDSKDTKKDENKVIPPLDKEKNNDKLVKEKEVPKFLQKGKRMSYSNNLQKSDEFFVNVNYKIKSGRIRKNNEIKKVVQKEEKKLNILSGKSKKAEEDKNI